MTDIRNSTKWTYQPFKAIPVGSKFILNGNRYQKQSTKTAYMIEANRVFYVGQKEQCKRITNFI